MNISDYRAPDKDGMAEDGIGHRPGAAAGCGTRVRGGLRADAERNRERLLAAARHMFAEHGLEVSLEDIAERAGVGIATLYRRFSTREDLVSAAFEAKLAEYARVAEESLAEPDPWRSFAGCLEKLCAMQAGDRGFTEIVNGSLLPSERITEARARTASAVARVVERAQRAGVVRDDAVAEDIPLILMANAGVVRATRGAAPHAWRRMLAYLLDGFRATSPGAGRAMPAPLTPAQIQKLLTGAPSHGSDPPRHAPD